MDRSVCQPRSADRQAKSDDDQAEPHRADRGALAERYLPAPDVLRVHARGPLCPCLPRFVASWGLCRIGIRRPSGHPARHSRPKPSAVRPTRCVHVLPTLDRSAAAALSEEYTALLKEEEELDAMLKEVRRGLAPQPTSAPGPGSPLPHLHRDWVHPCHFTFAASLGRIFRGVGPGESSGRAGWE